MYDKNTFSERLKEVRAASKKTQLEFATFVGSTAATISAYENATKNPSLEIVANIASKCNVSLDWLCGFSYEKTGSKIKSYADIFRFLLALQENKELEFSILASTPDSPKSGIIFEDTTINTFIEDWKKMSGLLENGTIDQEVFDLWREKTLKKSNTLIIPNFLK